MIAGYNGGIIDTIQMRITDTQLSLPLIVLAIAIQMLAFPILFATGLAQPTYPLLFPLGAVVGGLLFGASMTLAGGCAKQGRQVLV